MKISASSKTFWQTIFAFTFIVNLVILIWSISRWIELKVELWHSVWALPLALYLALLVGCVFLFVHIRTPATPRRSTGAVCSSVPHAGQVEGGADGIIAALETDTFRGTFWRIAGVAVFVVIVLAIPYLKFSFRVGEVVKKSTQDPVLTMIVFYWAVWWLVLLAAGALKVAFKTSWAGGFASALVILGVIYEIFLRYQAVTAYPFSMGWSESSRFYYASLYFAQAIYGIKTPLSSLHPTRYFLQSPPFLIPGLGLVASRFWQLLLWIVLTGMAAVTLAWRVLPGKENPRHLSPAPQYPVRGARKVPGSTRRGTKENQPFVLLRVLGGQNGLRWLFAGWFFLFLLRVGVYYHLEVMVIIPLLFVSAKHPWRLLAALVFASAWAGVSRVNWFPVPAMIAIAIYLLEEPVSSYKNIWRYLVQPLLWMVIGLGSALAAQGAYIPLSGNGDNARAFSSSFTSDLLWNRLWPNDSFALGVLPGILILSGPLLIVLAQALRGRFSQLHPLRWLGLVCMLAALFAGGLVVSVKIGGGGDLHNMDAYAVLVGIAAAYFIGGKVSAENASEERRTLSWPIAAVALLIPLIFLVASLAPFEKFNEKADAAAFEQLKTLAVQAGQKGPVLFINERHLLTFHKINLPLVPEYEAVTLMEMAMSNNRPYLQQFYADMKAHRFAAIVAGKQNVGLKDEGAFAEENNIWNARVSPYIVCYYEAVAEIEADESRIEFYVPRNVPGTCP